MLEYNLDGRSVVLFKCDWYKLDGKKTELKDDGFFKSINVGSLWYKNDCYILSTQARKVFYLPDTRWGQNWQVVQTFNHRHLYNVSQTESTQYRDDEQSPIFEGVVLRQLMKESDRAACRHDDEEDDTLMEYCNEGGGPIGVDSDDE